MSKPGLFEVISRVSAVLSLGFMVSELARAARARREGRDIEADRRTGASIAFKAATNARKRTTTTKG